MVGMSPTIILFLKKTEDEEDMGLVRICNLKT